METNIFKLAKKLKALADRGIGGEKENATRMLVSLCEKHGIDMTLLEENVRKDHQFFLDDNYETRLFFTQIASSVLGDCYITTYSYKLKRAKGKKRHGLTCTDAEFVEIMGKFEFYNYHYKKEAKLFYKAFIQKNRLWCKPSDSDGDDSDERELTPEEKLDLFKIANMMEGMERKIFVKQIDK